MLRRILRKRTRLNSRYAVIVETINDFVSASGYGENQLHHMLDFIRPNEAGMACKALLRVWFMTRHVHAANDDDGTTATARTSRCTVDDMDDNFLADAQPCDDDGLGGEQQDTAAAAPSGNPPFERHVVRRGPRHGLRPD